MRRSRPLTMVLPTAAVLCAAVVITPFLWALRIAREPTFTLSVPFIPEAVSVENFRTLLGFTNFPRWA